MPARPLPPAAYIRQRLRYEPETGRLFWRHHAAMSNNWNSKWAGREAFTAMHKTGYRHGTLDSAPYKAHRIIWAYMTGECCANSEIDHVNHDRGDNRWCNLRLVSRADNMRNKSTSKLNTSGRTGVTKGPRRKRWIAQISVDYRVMHLGCFDTFEEACAARHEAEQKYGFHENHGPIAST